MDVDEPAHARHARLPAGDGDNVFVTVERGGRHHYEIEVPRDHPGGIFWYHPHRHGGVAQQVRGGMAGLIVVRGEIDRVREVPVWDEDAPAGVGEDLLAWTDDMAAVIAPHTPDESYQNFPDRRIENWPQQYYAENWDRLVEVETRYDRHDVFRNPQSIPPRERGRHGHGHGHGDHGDRRSHPGR